MTKKMFVIIITSFVMLGFFYLFPQVVKICDYLSSIYTYTYYAYVLESVELIDRNEQILFSDTFKPHKRAELSKFREYNAKLGQDKINIQIGTQFQDQMKILRIYLNNEEHDLSNKVNKRDIRLMFDEDIIEGYEVFDSEDGAVKIKMMKKMKLFDEDAEIHIGKLEIILPLHTGETFKLLFDFNQYNGIAHVTNSKYPNTKHDQQMLKYFFGIDYDQEKIDKNLSF